MVAPWGLVRGNQHDETSHVCRSDVAGGQGHFSPWFLGSPPDGQRRCRRVAARFLYRFFTVMGALAVGGFILYALYYGQDLEYRYEVFSIMIDWVSLIVTGLLLSRFFVQPEK